MDDDAVSAAAALNAVSIASNEFKYQCDNDTFFAY